MSTNWTNEANGSISTTGNELEATTLSVTGTATVNTLTCTTFDASTINIGYLTISGEEIMASSNCNLTLVGASSTISCNAAQFLVNSPVSEAHLYIGNHLTNDSTGSLHMTRSTATGDAPYIHMTSFDGTDSYLFVANNGTLRISSTQPTADTDGSPV